LNILEELDNSAPYTTLDQYHLDVRDIRYKQMPAFRAAIDRKLQRSWENIKGEATANQRHGGKYQAFATATRDANGQIITKVSTDALGLAAEAAASREDNSGGRFEVLPGGVIRYTGRG